MYQSYIHSCYIIIELHPDYLWSTFDSRETALLFECFLLLISKINLDKYHNSLKVKPSDLLKVKNIAFSSWHKYSLKGREPNCRIWWLCICKSESKTKNITT